MIADVAWRLTVYLAAFVGSRPSWVHGGRGSVGSERRRLQTGHMKRLQKALRPILLICTGFLAVTAIPGGCMLLLGVYAPPIEMLKGSFFGSFVVPGLALAGAVGGASLLALALIVRRSAWGDFSAAVAGLVVMSFEFIQVVSIGSPAGSARAMQLGYFALGILLVGASLLRLQASRYTRQPAAPGPVD